ncbi:MAG: hypothetical protein U0166_07360 [Acidobacteriota bacterium]
MGAWNQDALKAVAAIRTQLKTLSAEEDAALKEAVAAVENDGKPSYSKGERARAHAALARVEQVIGPKARTDVDRLKTAFNLTLGPET